MYYPSPFDVDVWEGEPVGSVDSQLVILLDLFYIFCSIQLGPFHKEEKVKGDE